MIFPTLAVVTSVFGIILLSRENLAGGIAFFVLLQLWLIAAVVVHIRRTRLPVTPEPKRGDGGPQNP